MKAVRVGIVSNGASLPPNDVGRIALHVNKGQGKDRVGDVSTIGIIFL